MVVDPHWMFLRQTEQQASNKLQKKHVAQPNAIIRRLHFRAPQQQHLSETAGLISHQLIIWKLYFDRTGAKHERKKDTLHNLNNICN